MSDTIRLGNEDWSRVDGVDVCDHISLPNAYERNDPSEYMQTLTVYCNECEEEYTYSVLIN